MPTFRIIPCLDIKDGRTVKGVNFENLRDAGDAIELAKYYNEQGADELVFLDIAATNEGRRTIFDFAERVAKELSIPFTIGGGISQISDMETLFNCGADKISINSAAVRNPELIQEAAEKFGSQAIVVSVDTKKIPQKNQWTIHTHGGKKDSGIDALAFIQQMQKLGAGEFMCTSMDADGTKDGFDIKWLTQVKNIATVPVIASGGAGSIEDFIQIAQSNLAEAGLAASIFHFGEVPIPKLKQALKTAGINIRI